MLCLGMLSLPGRCCPWVVLYLGVLSLSGRCRVHGWCCVSACCHSLVAAVSMGGPLCRGRRRGRARRGRSERLKGPRPPPSLPRPHPWHSLPHASFAACSSCHVHAVIHGVVDHGFSRQRCNAQSAAGKGAVTRTPVEFRPLSPPLEKYVGSRASVHLTSGPYLSASSSRIAELSCWRPCPCACVSVRARSVLTLPRLSASPAGGERTTPDSSVPYLSLLRKSRGHAALALS
jgi:hypothetical protein